jgi:hypothetical protein
VVLVSAQSGLGMKEIWRELDRLLAEARDADKGQSWTSKN